MPALDSESTTRAGAALRPGFLTASLCAVIACAIPVWNLGAEGIEFENSLGMRFRPVHGTRVLFSQWETRVCDWRAFRSARQASGVQGDPPPFSQTEEHPAVSVSMVEAMEFCEWLTSKERASGVLTSSRVYRLPTDAEWDAAVGLESGGETSPADSGPAAKRFPWGDTWPPLPRAGNFNRAFIPGSDDDGFAFTAPVGRFDPSAGGLFDLAGNVWEWTVEEATPEDSGEMGCLRGGSWIYWRNECLESSFRLRVKRDLHAPSVGFRCVLADEALNELHRERDVAEESLRRRELTTRPKVSAEEVRTVQAELAARRDERAADAAALRAAGNRLPIPGEEHLNSLGMRLLPMPANGVLIAQREIHRCEFDAFAVENGLRRRSGDSDEAASDQGATGMTWVEAVSFCRWLTLRERARDRLPDGASYRLPFVSERELIDVGDNAEWCQDVRPERPLERACWGGAAKTKASAGERWRWIEASAAGDLGFRVVLDFKPAAQVSLSRTRKMDGR